MTAGMQSFPFAVCASPVFIMSSGCALDSAFRDQCYMGGSVPCGPVLLQ